MKKSSRICILAFICASFAPPTWTADKSLSCNEQSTTILDFTPGTLPFPDGTNITTQFQSEGVTFSADDSDLPPQFRQSLGWQENRVQDGMFYNLFRLNFPSSGQPTTKVGITFHDSNGNRQVHTLTAFDSAGNVLDKASFTEYLVDTTYTGYPFPDRFTLVVSSCKGIASVVAIESPFGAEVVERIFITTGR